MYALAANPFFRPLPGMGTASPSPIAVGESVGGAVATSVGTVLAQTGAIAASTVPIIGAGIALVTTLINALGIGKGCGQTCIETSQWANQAEPLLLQNIQAYFAQPAPRSLSSQQAALANFQTVWNNLVTLCTQPNLGTAGQKCISDRQSGACTWKQTSTSALLQYTQYGEPATGQCWNWWSGYHDPIANDPDVIDDSASALAQGAVDTTASVVSSAASALGISSSVLPILGIAAAVLVAWMVLK